MNSYITNVLQIILSIVKTKNFNFTISEDKVKDINLYIIRQKEFVLYRER